MRFQNLFNRFTRSQFFEDELHGYAGARNDGFTHHYCGI